MVVFTPLPVELGDAPINIKEIHKSTVAAEIFAIGIVLKPAVLSEVEWKKLTRSFSVRGIEDKVPARLYSKPKNSKVPESKRIPVISIENLEFTLIFCLFPKANS